MNEDSLLSIQLKIVDVRALEDLALDKAKEVLDENMMGDEDALRIAKCYSDLFVTLRHQRNMQT